MNASGRPRVLDASALLALLNSEPGADAVEEAVDGAAMSTVNWSEVLQRSIAARVDVQRMRADVEALGLYLVPLTADDAESAAALCRPTRAAGLSPADRACLALAQRLEARALTADRSWLGLDVGVEIALIRGSSTVAMTSRVQRAPCGRSASGVRCGSRTVSRRRPTRSGRSRRAQPRAGAGGSRVPPASTRPGAT